MFPHFGIEPSDAMREHWPVGSLLVIVAVSLVAIAWVRANHKNRSRWLDRLSLPGNWQWEQGDGSLELLGELDQGRYRIAEGTKTESGQWRIDGHLLRLRPDGINDELAYDLRLFDDGKIGVHGPGRERRIYNKTPTNVVPLRRSGG